MDSCGSARNWRLSWFRWSYPGPRGFASRRGVRRSAERRLSGLPGSMTKSTMYRVLDINAFGYYADRRDWGVEQTVAHPPSPPATVLRQVDEDAVGVGIKVVCLFSRSQSRSNGSRRPGRILCLVYRTAKQHSRAHEHRPSIAREPCEVLVVTHTPFRSLRYLVDEVEEPRSSVLLAVSARMPKVLIRSPRSTATWGGSSQEPRRVTAIPSHHRVASDDVGRVSGLGSGSVGRLTLPSTVIQAHHHRVVGANALSER